MLNFRRPQKSGNMYWLILSFYLCFVTAGSTSPNSDKCVENTLSQPIPFLDKKGYLDFFETGDVTIYPTGMEDDVIDYIEDVKFILYTRLNKDNGQRLYLNNITSINTSNLKPAKLTKFVIHGWYSNYNLSMAQDNKDELLKNYDFNVIAVDWSALAITRHYFWCVKKVPDVGDYVGQFISFLVSKASVKPADVHLIGHSLGAHVAGFAGKAVQKEKYSVSRISGLDPALPGFIFAAATGRLSASDAKYVDCIHTSSLGFQCPICQADFYPNSGFPLPNCNTLIFCRAICGHVTAYEYYAASIQPANVFHAYACSKVKSGYTKDCQSKDTAQMGYPAGDKKYKGIYTVHVTKKPPYCINGECGILDFCFKT